jgi:hypothetical protein
MSEMPRVLVGTPIYEKKEYCRKKFVDTIKQLTYPNYTFVMVDNSKGNSYLKKLRMDGVPAVKVDRGRNSRDALANASNYLRKRVLDGGYDYLMMVESDLFPRPDIIEQLMKHMDVDSPFLMKGKRVVGAPYHIGMGNGKKLCIFRAVKDKQGMMKTESLNPGDEEWFLNGQLWQVHGMGVGCTLIHRSILERFRFWYSELDDDRMAGMPTRKHPDVYFYLDLHNNHIPVYCDSSLYTIHEPSGWESVKDI